MSDENGTLLSERIRKALADAIATGVIAEGTALDEQVIASRFNASRTPVREALRILATDGLIVMRPRRGAIVNSFSIERISAMFEMSAEIEAMCVRLATNRMTPIERANLQKLHEESEQHILDRDIDAYASFNVQFHDAIYRATRNDFIVEQAQLLRGKMASFRRAQLFEHGRVEKSRDEHAHLLDAIMRGDGEEAARRMRAHMFNAAGALARQISEPRPRDLPA